MSYYNEGPEYYDDDAPRVELEPGNDIRVKQIIAGQFESTRDGTASYSVIGLAEDGCVYRYDVRRAGWIAWSMRSLNPSVRRSR